MAEQGLFTLVESPHCQAIMLERWNPPRGRFFVGYRTRHGFTSLMGNGVVDEFRTISAPIFLAPAAQIGAIYDLGMRLADMRDIEAPIDTGWPPLTVGVDIAAPEPAVGWFDAMLGALKSGTSIGTAPWTNTRQTGAVDGAIVDVLQVASSGITLATVLITDAPLLPAQLERMADMDDAPITVAVSTGNRLPYVESGDTHQVDVLSEVRFAEIRAGIRQMLSR